MKMLKKLAIGYILLNIFCAIMAYFQCVPNSLFSFTLTLSAAGLLAGSRTGVGKLNKILVAEFGLIFGGLVVFLVVAMTKGVYIDNEFERTTNLIALILLVPSVLDILFSKTE